MYFLIIYGRKFELLAISESLAQGFLSSSIIPVIIPVNCYSLLNTTIEKFITANRRIAVVLNPQVGSFPENLQTDGNRVFHDRFRQLLDNHIVIPSYHLTSFVSGIAMPIQGSFIRPTLFLPHLLSKGRSHLTLANPEISWNDLICNGSGTGNSSPLKQILYQDCFPYRPRNADYWGIQDEVFSSNHLCYANGGYGGFSDFSIIGAGYREKGFTPYAHAIHITHFDNNMVLRISHFVSDSNGSQKGQKEKFHEAAEKLVEWNKTMRLNTVGIQALETCCRTDHFPGLGKVKQYSLMHHIELMSKYLEQDSVSVWYVLSPPAMEKPLLQK